MSAGPVPSPIQRLNFDILWHVFDLNADIFDDYRALETTLAASYVCHDWRSLLLNSTSIWAHVMDLSHWKCFTAKGSRELIRRSGDSVVVDTNGHHNKWLFLRKESGSEYSGHMLGPNSEISRHYL